MQTWLSAHGWRTLVVDDDTVVARTDTKRREYRRVQTITGWFWRIERTKR